MPTDDGFRYRSTHPTDCIGGHGAREIRFAETLCLRLCPPYDSQQISELFDGKACLPDDGAQSAGLEIAARMDWDRYSA